MNATELGNVVTALSNRSDLNVYVIGALGAMAEAEIQTSEGITRSVYAEASTTVTSVAGTLTLPTDLIELRYVTFLNSSNRINTLTQRNFGAVLQDSTNTESYSASYARSGNQLFLDSYSDGEDFVIHYYKIIDPLGVYNTNWVSEKFPNLYIYKTLSLVFDYYFDQDRSLYWQSKFSNELERVRQHLISIAYTGGNLTIEPIISEMNRGR